MHHQALCTSGSAGLALMDLTRRFSLCISCMHVVFISKHISCIPNRLEFTLVPNLFYSTLYSLSSRSESEEIDLYAYFLGINTIENFRV
jgi:hypothetical protein